MSVSKAGFATGLGMLSTPLMAEAVPARTAIGVILPLLCLADVFTLAVYWRRWDLRLVAWPLLGSLLGIASATAFVTSISELALRRSIGGVGLLLTLLLVVRNRYHPHAVYRPAPWHGVLVGVAAGVSSTIAHAAGQILALPPRPVSKTNCGYDRDLHREQPHEGAAHVATGLKSADFALSLACRRGALRSRRLLGHRHLQKHFDTVIAVLDRHVPAPAPRLRDAHDEPPFGL
jgi:hypothetical protein